MSEVSSVRPLHVRVHGEEKVHVPSLPDKDPEESQTGPAASVGPGIRATVPGRAASRRQGFENGQEESTEEKVYLTHSPTQTHTSVFDQIVSLISRKKRKHASTSEESSSSSGEESSNESTSSSSGETSEDDSGSSEDSTSSSSSDVGGGSSSDTDTSSQSSTDSERNRSSRKKRRRHRR